MTKKEVSRIVVIGAYGLGAERIAALAKVGAMIVDSGPPKITDKIIHELTMYMDSDPPPPREEKEWWRKGNPNQIRRR
jgi:hypothetical protein